MKTISLGSSGPSVSNIALGMMRITDKTDDDIRELYATARDAGINVFDHAAIYGGRMHGCEDRFAKALKLSPSERNEIVIQTKAGILAGQGYDSSYEHLVTSAEESLRSLGTDYIDVFLIHRPDALAEPEEVARAFDDLEAAGKVRAFGVSNHTAGQIELLKRSVRQPLVVNQLQLSIPESPLVTQGIASNVAGSNDSITRDGGGLLDYCRLNGITVQAWSPFQAGFFKGTFLGSPDYPELNAVIDRLAEKYGVPAIAIATAWITRHPADIQVVLGTTTPSRVASSCLGSDLPLTRVEWYELFQAAGHDVP